MTMKKMFWWLLPLSFALSACPFETNVALSPGPSEPVDSTLYGYWYGIIKDFSDVYGIEALEITKQSDSVYAITRYGKAVKGDMILPDTANYTGFISYIGEKRFMNVEGTALVPVYKKNKPIEYRKEKVYYLSLLERRNDTLHVKTVTDDFSTRKTFKSPDELKNLVTESLSQQKNIYDELYVLSYRKIQKPQQLKPL
jgi:hypothetical protein